MKTLLLTLLAAASLHTAMAQANTRGSMITDPYYGFPNFGGYFLRAISEASGVEGFEFGGAGPTGLRTEFMLTDRIGLGADAIYSNLHLSYTQTDSVYDGNTDTWTTTKTDFRRTMNRLRVHVRINFHFNVDNPNLDMYWGIAAGTNKRYFGLEKNGVKVDASDDDFWSFPALPFSMRTCWGMRYYFLRNVGFNLEIGFGGPLISTGISTRFGLRIPQRQPRVE